MSLIIDNRRISGIYALGQWFKVSPDSFVIDAFQLRYIGENCCFGYENNNSDPGEEPRPPITDWYELGTIYEHTEPKSLIEKLRDGSTMKNPQGCHGVAFTDADTGETVYLSLIECRAFRCVSKAEAIKANPFLDPAFLDPEFLGSQN
jgi:hypothetical protein